MKKNTFTATVLLLFITVLSLITTSCEGDSPEINNEPEIITPQTIGSGFFEYEFSPNDITLKVYYHVPEDVTANSPILFVFHGNGRNARDYRNAMVTKSEALNFIVITPEFSIANFPSGDQYNLGNVFIDGDNPTPATLNPENEWTFSIIEPLFNDIKIRLNNTTDSYDVFGHSAGGQFAHRLLEFKPQSRFNKVVASASGWYTAPDETVRFPYGFKDSPLENISLNTFLSHDLTILIGSQDNDPNAPALRRNSVVDQQGTNRLARAQYFYNRGQEISNNINTTFNWQLKINPGADHDYIAASIYAADLLYNN